MFFTKECDYAIRVVRELADLEMRPVKAICDREHIPPPFAYKILKKLDKAGIVVSRRGATGGYQLAKSPERISLFDIVSAIDKHLLLNACLEEGHVCTRNEDGSSCSVKKELNKLQQVVVDALVGKNMSDVV